MKNRAIESLYKCRKFNDCIGKMQPKDLQDDLRSEVILFVSEKDDDFVIGLHDRGELSFYAIRIAVNFITKTNSSFNKRFRILKTDEVPEMVCPELNGRADLERLQDPLLIKLTELRKLAYQKIPQYDQSLYPEINWYKQYMISLYMKVGSYRKMETETQIPWEACYVTVKQTMKLLKEKYKINQNEFISN